MEDAVQNASEQGKSLINKHIPHARLLLRTIRGTGQDHKGI